MRAVTLSLTSRVTGAILLLLGGLLAAAPPASAAESGTVTLTASCPYLGSYDAGVHVTESFSGLTVTPYSYRVVATRAATVGADTIAPDSSGWYADPDASHVSGPAYTFVYNGTGPTPVVAPGDTYHWTLYYSFAATPGLPGTITVVRNGQVWAHGGVADPGSGTDVVALRLTRKARHQLASHHRARTVVTVVLFNAYGSTSAGTTLALCWA